MREGRPPPAAGELPDGRAGRVPLSVIVYCKMCLELGQHDLRSLLHRPLEGEAAAAACPPPPSSTAIPEMSMEPFERRFPRTEPGSSLAQEQAQLGAPDLADYIDQTIALRGLTPHERRSSSYA